MAIKYGIYKTPVPNNRRNKQEMHGRFVSNGHTGITRLCKLVSARTKMSDGDVKAVLDGFIFAFKTDLEAGFIIELEGIGNFYPALQSYIEINEKGEPRLNVQVKTIRFRCARSLRKEAQDYAVVRDHERCFKDNNLTSAQRKASILNYLKKNVSITTRYARLLNSCTKKVALQDLKELKEEKKILSVGNGRNSLYIRAYE